MNNREQLTKVYFEKEGDDQLFPNHSNLDIYTKGFLARDKAEAKESYAIRQLRKNLNEGYISNEKAMLINQLLNIHMRSTRELMNICLTKDEQSKIDMAYPDEYAKRIREVLPKWNGMFNVYDYRNSKVFGEMLNVAELFTTHVLKVFTSNDIDVIDIPDETDTKHEKRVTEFPKFPPMIDPLM